MNRAFIETFGVEAEEARSHEFELGRIFEASSATLAEGRIIAWECGKTPPPVEVIGRDAQGNALHLELRGSRIDYRGAPAAECLLIDNTEARRIRHWDSCFNVGTSYTAGGTIHNSIRSRYRQWLTHKLATWEDQFDTCGCTGCGRCITWCPVGIDLTEEVATIRGRSDSDSGA